MVKRRRTPHCKKLIDGVVTDDYKRPVSHREVVNIDEDKDDASASMQGDGERWTLSPHQG
jgi:hypothetical protein